MGPLLLGRMLGLNETQQGVLQLVFKIADDKGLLLLDLKDLRAMLQYVGDNARDFTTQYGNVSVASIGAIQRGLMQIETQGGTRFFGEPMLNISDFMQTDATGLPPFPIEVSPLFGYDEDSFADAWTKLVTKPVVASGLYLE
jgi:DNA helicase HerA-like ATPase